MILLGQTIISCAQPLVNNVINRFSSTWFTDKERTLVTAICGLSIPGGNLVAFLLCGFIYKGVDKLDDESIKLRTMDKMWVQNFWITAACVPFFILIRERPEHAPSISAFEVSN